jgi:DNA-nicking Smr family endonuclease
MAKREKVTKATPKPKPEAPFFRPFAELGREAKKGGAKGAATPAEPSAGGAKGTAPKPGAAKVSAAKPTTSPKAAPAPAAAPPVDTDTFAIFMAGVRTLDEDRANRIPRGASRVERVPDAARRLVLEREGDPDADARARMRSLVGEGIRFETSDDGERIEGRRLDVDPRELRRLRRGEHAVDGKLDLHGMTAEEARLAVEAFLAKRALEGDRTLLVVHGKGSHSPRGHAILRGEIAAWLSQGRAARHVAAFATAPDDAGGTGALLVLLAR